MQDFAFDGVKKLILKYMLANINVNIVVNAKHMVP